MRNILRRKAYYNTDQGIVLPFSTKDYLEKTMKRFVLILAAVCLIFSLAACGSTAAPGTASAPAEKEESSASPEFIYSASYSNFSLPQEARKAGVLLVNDSGYYTFTGEKVGSSLREGEPVSYEGQGEIRENYLSFCSFDGNLSRLEKYVPLENYSLEDGMYRADITSGISSLAALKDGNLLSVETRSISYVDAPDLSSDSPDYRSHTHVQSETFVRVLAADGSEISRISADSDAGAVSVTGFLDPDGNILVLNGMTVAALRPDGSVAYELNCPYYPDGLVEFKGGELAAFCYDNGWSFLPVNFTQKSFGSKIPLDSTYGMNFCLCDSGEYDLYYTDGSFFKGFKRDSATSDVIFSWVDCDVNYAFLGQTFVTEDGTVTALDRSRADAGDFSLVTMKKVPYDPSVQKKEITFATQSLQPDVQSAIIRFNRTNPEYRIRVIDYSEYNTQDDYSAGILKMKTEIMGGNVPDIIDLAGMPMDQMAANGILEDLKPFVEADAEIDLQDFFPNVLAGTMVGDKMVSTVSSFYVMTAIGASKVVGDEPGWTYDEFNAALADMPEGCTPFEQYITQTDILEKCLQLDLDDFVDWDTGRVDFDNEEFVNLLKFANSFQKEYNWETFGEGGKDDSLETRLATGRQMLINGYVSSFEYLLYEASTSFSGMDVTYIGYPTASGETNGSMLGITAGYAISTSCNNKDVAWQFIREFMTKDYLKTVYGLPASRSLFLEELEKFKQIEYEKDADGNFLLDEKGEKIPVVRCSYSMGAGQEEVPVYCMSDSLAEKVLTLVEQTTKIANYDTTIPDIVKEDVQSYFAGQKTAEDVAKLVQSKANIYVTEQR